MPKILDDAPMVQKTRADRPLSGSTVLMVEDSRFASEAVRLLCLKSGARIRRADTLASAQRHLSVYQPTILIVDLGLPDGSGLDLIARMAKAPQRIPAILATSGDDCLFNQALAAGADGVLAKPIESLAVFQRAVLDRLPDEYQPQGLALVPSETVVPDQIAFHEDLAHVASLLHEGETASSLDYATQFLTGVARSAHDRALADATDALAQARAHRQAFGPELARLVGLVQKRLEGRAVV
ncbi:MAG: response regulator [Pseudomonadota bacterium]